ncbi:MAG: translation initiation factor IF-2 [Opitutus sp.]|nr:translation initiation factor IF-2 [Opitutus sp.]
MSLRIHELAKRYNMEGKDMLALLKERGYVSADTKSVSSTVANIYVEELEKEFAAKAAAEQAAAAVTPEASEPPSETPSTAPIATDEDSNEAPKLRLPAGAFVKTKADIEREREAAAKAKAAAAKAPAPVTPPPMPAPRAVSAPAPVAPPRPASPPPLPPRPVPPPPAPTVKAAPAVSISAPRPVSSPAPAPAIPPPVSKAPTAPRMVSPAPLPPPVAPSNSPTAIPTPVAPAAAGESAPESSGEIKIIHLKPPIIVRDFAAALGLKPFKLISELNQAGGFASMNSNIDEAMAVKVAEKHGFILEIKHRGEPKEGAKDKKAEKKPEEDESKFLQPRPPVICILGHVDHGKTSLLDAIRKANVASGEAGGITQHIGAYQIEFQDRKLTFLDTPGHAAFTKMRSRGASVTDVAILVVAADDGFMPQTDEALRIALGVKEQHPEKFALIVAVNKMDVKGANLDQVKAQMQQRNIAPEDWGGETVTVPVSAIKGTGINELLEMILLQADVLELKANPKAEASGVIIESQIDVGRGPLATVIVQRGTLRVGDALVCGPHYARVRAMFDDQGRNLKEAPPATPVRVIGWSGAPDSGSAFRAVKNAREAEKLAEEEQQRLRKLASVSDAQPKEVSVEQLFANIAATQAKVLKLIIKTDVFGSSEAVRNVLEGIKSSKVSVEIVSTDVGLVTKNDVTMAAAAGAVVIGFNTKLENGVTALAALHHSAEFARPDRDTQRRRRRLRQITGVPGLFPPIGRAKFRHAGTAHGSTWTTSRVSASR